MDVSVFTTVCEVGKEQQGFPFLVEIMDLVGLVCSGTINTASFVVGD